MFTELQNYSFDSKVLQLQFRLRGPLLSGLPYGKISRPYSEIFQISSLYDFLKYWECYMGPISYVMLYGSYISYLCNILLSVPLWSQYSRVVGFSFIHIPMVHNFIEKTIGHVIHLSCGLFYIRRIKCFFPDRNIPFSGVDLIILTQS